MPTTVQIDGKDVTVYTEEEVRAQAEQAVKDAQDAKAKADADAQKAAEAQGRDKALDERLAIADKAREQAEAELAKVKEQLAELADNSKAVGRVRELEGKMAELLRDIEAAHTDSRALISEDEMKKRINEAAASARRDAEKKAKDLEALLAQQEEATGKELKALREKIEQAEKKEAEATAKSAQADALVVLKDAGLNTGGVALLKRILPDLLTDTVDLTTEDGRKAFIKAVQDEYPVLFGGESGSAPGGSGTAGVAGKKATTPGGATEMDRLIRQQLGRI